MPICNIEAIQSGGSLIFQNDSTKADILTINADGTVYISASRPNYTVTNDSTDRTFDADSLGAGELADVVATIIADLITLGIFQ